jgi:hypothetical protein
MVKRVRRCGVRVRAAHHTAMSVASAGGDDRKCVHRKEWGIDLFAVDVPSLHRNTATVIAETTEIFTVDALQVKC